jgi:hypothetical protein
MDDRAMKGQSNDDSNQDLKIQQSTSNENEETYENSFKREYTILS